MQTLHIEDALINGSSVPGYAVVNWDQVTAIELEHTLRHEPNPVVVTLRLADGNTVRPHTKIKGFPVPVVAKELKTFVYVHNRVNGLANFSGFQAYLEEKHDEK